MSATTRARAASCPRGLAHARVHRRLPRCWRMRRGWMSRLAPAPLRGRASGRGLRRMPTPGAGADGCAASEPHQHHLAVAVDAARAAWRAPAPAAAPHRDAPRRRARPDSPAGNTPPSPEVTSRSPSSRPRCPADRAARARPSCPRPPRWCAAPCARSAPAPRAPGSVIRMTSALQGPTRVVCPSSPWSSSTACALKTPLLRAAIDEHALAQAVQLDVHDLGRPATARRPAAAPSRSPRSSAFSRASAS